MKKILLKIPVLTQALWDQNLALRWVQDHAASFGGDPDRVTLVGEGSGAACAGCHLASPHSAGLFHRAVLMSGSPSAPAQRPDKDPAAAVGAAFARGLGCGRDAKEPKDILREMQEKRCL